MHETMHVLESEWNMDHSFKKVPDSKVHGSNMGPTWVMSAPDRPTVGPMNIAIRGASFYHRNCAMWNWSTSVCLMIHSSHGRLMGWTNTCQIIALGNYTSKFRNWWTSLDDYDHSVSKDGSLTLLWDANRQLWNADVYTNAPIFQIFIW